MTKSQTKNYLKIAILLVATASLLSARVAATREVIIVGENLTLNANFVVAGGSQPSDKVVLILHGTLAHKDMELISTVQDAFQEVGQSSLAINLSLNIDDRQGFFPCDELHTHHVADALDEIEAWINWLSARGVKQIVLLGHSRGANQVARFVLRSPHSVQAAVLLAPSINDAVADKRVLNKASEYSDDGQLEDINFLLCENANVKVSSYLSYYGPDANTDSIPLIQQLMIPTLLVSGSEDTVTKGLASRAANIDNQLVTHIEIIGAGHFFRDLYAYDVVDAVIEFAQEIDH